MPELEYRSEKVDMISQGYACAECAGTQYAGTGWIETTREGNYTHPNHPPAVLAAAKRKGMANRLPTPGTPIVYEGVRPCSCHGTIEAQRLLDRAQIPFSHRECTMNGWHQETEAHVDVVDHVMTRLEAPELAPSGLLLWGMPGSGKTHVGVAALRGYAILHARQIRFVSVPALFEDVRASFSNEATNESSILSRLRTVDVLMLDDLGIDGGTEWQQSLLYRIIDSRNRPDRVTIITTNMSPGDLGALLGRRIESRLAQMCLQVKFPDVDWRQR